MLEAVRARPYRLDPHGHWAVDRASVQQAITDRTRALLVVSPNNPTGSLLRRDDREWLVALAAERRIAIVSDEVFADYPLRPLAAASSLLGETRALTFTLGGLSKSAGLPQVKLGWMIVQGPASLVPAALERLEIICDTYLSVSTPVQVAAPALLRSGRAIRQAIHARVSGNLASFRRALARWPAASLLEPEGGWSAVLQVPSVAPEEALTLDALTRARVLVHPGHFFDFDREAFVVVSLLPEPDRFNGAVDRLLPILAGDRA
jgi:alanine-synthesizing transaminase